MARGTHCVLYFEDEQADLATWLLDNARAVALQATTANGASAAEAQSYCTVFEVAEDGSQTIVDAWHVSQGQVVDGLPDPDAPAPDPDEWSVGVVYVADDIVTYQDGQYRCLQGHTSQTGWEPPNVPALWQAI